MKEKAIYESLIKGLVEEKAEVNAIELKIRDLMIENQEI